jgi:hypothetical protein
VGLGVLIQHNRHKRVNTIDYAHEIDVQYPFPAFQWYFPTAAAPVTDPGIVAQHMDRAEGLKRLAGQCLNLLYLGHIRRYPKQIGIEFLKRIQGTLQPFFIDVGHNDLHSDFQETF